MKKHSVLIISLLGLCAVLMAQTLVRRAVDNSVLDNLTAAAPVPTDAEDQIINVFSNHYANAIGASLGPTVTGGDIQTDKFGKADDLLYVQDMKGGNMEGIVFAQPIDATNYDILHIDVYAVTGGANGLRPRVTLADANGGGGTTPGNQAAVAVAKVGEWTSYDISITELVGKLSSAPDITKLKSIWFFDYGGGNRTYFVDNIYFKKTGGDEGGGETPEPSYPDAPTTLPAAPTADASEVLSFLSPYYTSSVGYGSHSGTGQTVEMRNVKTEGDVVTPMLYVGQGLNGWCDVFFAESKDISKYGFLEMDVYVVSGAFDLKVRLSDGTTAVVASPKLQPGWNHVKLALADFTNSLTPPSLTGIDHIGLINNNGYQRSLYILNVYASGDASQSQSDPDMPSVMAPTPTAPAIKVKSLFSDVYTPAGNISGLTTSGTGTLKVLAVSPTEKLLKIEEGLNFWTTIGFTAVDFSDRDMLHVDFYYPYEESTNVKFMFDQSLSTAYEVTAVKGWNNYDIPLADMTKSGQSLTVVTQFSIINTAGAPISVYLDNIYAYGEKDVDGSTEDPTAPTVAAPTPVHKAGDVMSLWSSYYTNATELTLDNPGQPTCEMDAITVGDNKYLRLTGMNWCLLKLNPALNLNEYDYIHFEVYALNDPKIVIGLGNGGDKEGRTPWQYLQPGWKSIDMPTALLKENGADLSETSILRIYSATGFAISKLYFDHIYAYKGSPSGDVITYEIAQSPEPIMPKPEVVSVLTDKYDATLLFSADEIQGETEVTFPKVEEGDRVMKFDQLTKGAAKSETPIDISKKETLHISVYSKTTDGEAHLAFRSAGMTSYAEVQTQPQLEAKNWTYVNIPISELTAAGVDATQLTGIQVEGKGTIYLDNIYAFSGEYYEGLGEEGTISVDWETAKVAEDLCSRDIALMGVNLGSACGGAKHGDLNVNYFYPTMEDLWYFKGKGVRLFRFPFAWERVQHEVNGDLDMSLDVAKMEEVVAECERLGIYVMLDMHNYCRREVNGVKYKFGENEAVLSLDHFADVWKKLATVFKKYKNIFGYDIMNEPYGLTPGIWAQAAQKAIDAIREVDTTTPIVIEGESYASSRTWMTNGAKLATQLTDPSNNLIWQAHCYFDKNSSGLYELGSYDDEVYRATPALQRLKPFVDWLNENNFKGIVGEFGVPRNDARWLKMLDEVCTYLKENKVNATYWVAGTGYANDQVSVQPLKDYTQERAQMRVLSKYFNVESEDLPTSISNVTRQPQVAGTDAIYTLQGVKVPSQQKLAPGIYIQGGKKILVTK